MQARLMDLSSQIIDKVFVSDGAYRTVRRQTLLHHCFRRFDGGKSQPLDSTGVLVSLGGGSKEVATNHPAYPEDRALRIGDDHVAALQLATELPHLTGSIVRV